LPDAVSHRDNAPCDAVVAADDEQVWHDAQHEEDHRGEDDDDGDGDDGNRPTKTTSQQPIAKTMLFSLLSSCLV